MTDVQFRSVVFSRDRSRKIRENDIQGAYSICNIDEIKIIIS